MTQSDNNRTVQLGMVIGVVSTVALYSAAYILVPDFDAELPLIERLAMAVNCLIFPALFFASVVVRVGAQRFGNPAENPLDVVASSDAMRVNLRVLSNTHEQLVLFTINVFALSVVLPYSWLHLLPAYSGLFVLGRMVFWLGYAYNPLWRAPGFALTILPAVIGLAYSALALLRSIYWGS
jgi:hypothetical protein